jgi:peptide alpha-N-acetyltransferase
MLAVDPRFRHRGIATKLVELSCNGVKDMQGQEVVLETEVGNLGSLGLYSSLGFIKDKRLAKYYLCGSDAFRLKLLME